VNLGRFAFGIFATQLLIFSAFDSAVMSLFLSDKNLGEGCRSIARASSRRATIRHCRRASILFSPFSRGGYYRRYPDGGLGARQTPTAELEQI
jgi:hypothetical protein